MLHTFKNEIFEKEKNEIARNDFFPIHVQSGQGENECNLNSNLNFIFSAFVFPNYRIFLSIWSVLESERNLASKYHYYPIILKNYE